MADTDAEKEKKADDRYWVNADEAFAHTLSMFEETGRTARTVEEDRLLDEAEKQRLHDRREDNFRSSGVPKKYFNVELSEIRSSVLHLMMKTKDDKYANFDEVFIPFIADVAKGKPRALWLCGCGGTGKTAVALAVLRELCRAGVSAGYFKMHRVMQDFEETKYFSSRGRRMSDVMDELCRPRFRVIDEIGRYPVAEWEKFRLFDISNEVYEQGGSSIYISNLSRVELGNFLGAACVDRFRGSAMTLEFNGPSFRGDDAELYTEFGMTA